MIDQVANTSDVINIKRSVFVQSDKMIGIAGEHIIPYEMRPYRTSIELPAHSRISPTFHVSQLRKFRPNDPELFPDRGPPRPELILTLDGKLKHRIDRIVEERCVGRGCQYLVCWEGFGADEDEWLPRRELVA